MHRSEEGFKCVLTAVSLQSEIEADKKMGFLHTAVLTEQLNIKFVLRHSARRELFDK